MDPFFNFNQYGHGALVIVECDDRLQNFDLHVAPVKIFVGNQFEVVLEHIVIIGTAAGQPGQEPFFTSLHEFPQFFIGKNLITRKVDFRDQNLVSFVNGENDGGLILIIDLNVGFNACGMEPLITVGLTNSFNAFFDLFRIIEIGDTHGRQLTQLVVFKLFATGETDLTHQGALFDVINKDGSVRPLSRQSGHIPETP